MSEEEECSYDSDGTEGYEESEDEDLTMASRQEAGEDEDTTNRSLGAGEIFAKATAEVSKVESITGIDHDLALVALIMYRWNRDKLLDLYTESSETVLNSIGEPLDSTDSVPIIAVDIHEELASSPHGPPRKKLRRDKSPTSHMTAEKYVCDICCDEKSCQSSKPTMKCKHEFCPDCWKIFLTTKIHKEGQCLIRCMADKCNTSVREDFIKALTENEIYERWKTLVMQTYVTASPHLRFFPAPSCLWIAECMLGPSDFDLVAPTVACLEGHTFCFGCGIPNGHAPITCKIVNAWHESENSGSTQWIKANTRKCPKCNNNIEKAGGCNRMLCKHCSFQFCWVCLKNWDVHGYNTTVCNSYVEPESTPSMNEAQVQLDRWKFYYARYLNHEMSAKLDEELVKKSEEKMSAMQQLSGSWIETQFLRQAVEELTKCRQTLKWTYVMAYYLAAGNFKQIFEDIQADLEKAVEDLSQLVDSPVKESSYKTLRGKVIDKTVYVENVTK